MEIEEVRLEGRKKPLDYKQLYEMYLAQLNEPESSKPKMSKIVSLASSILTIDTAVRNIADDRKRHEAASKKEEQKRFVYQKEVKAMERKRQERIFSEKAHQIYASQVRAL